MKWGEVTWYSRLGAIILFIGVVPLLCFYVGMQYGLLVTESNFIGAKGYAGSIEKSVPVVANGSIQSASTYSPVKVEVPSVPVPHGGFKEFPSPDGKYIAMSYSNEGGDSAVYIASVEEDTITDAYCGFFDSWSSDSTKVKVLAPVECGSLVDYSYFYLTTDGRILPIE